MSSLWRVSENIVIGKSKNLFLDNCDLQGELCEQVVWREGAARRLQQLARSSLSSPGHAGTYNECFAHRLSSQ